MIEPGRASAAAAASRRGAGDRGRRRRSPTRVVGPRLQVLEGVQRRVVHAQRVRRVVYVLPGVGLETQHKPVGRLTLGLALFGRLTPEIVTRRRVDVIRANPNYRDCSIAVVCRYISRCVGVGVCGCALS